MSVDHPLSGATDHWEALVEDMAGLAEEYREEGWSALELQAGDVTVDPDLPGFSVLVAQNQFDELADLVGRCAFESHDVYRADAEGVGFVLVALEAEREREAVLVPLYYAFPDVHPLYDADRLHTEVRTLAGEEVVFAHEEPELFLPDGN